MKLGERRSETFKWRMGERTLNGRWLHKTIDSEDDNRRTSQRVFRNQDLPIAFPILGTARPSCRTLETLSLARGQSQGRDQPLIIRYAPRKHILTHTHTDETRRNSPSGWDHHHPHSAHLTTPTLGTHRRTHRRTPPLTARNIARAPARPVLHAPNTLHSPPRAMPS